MKILKLTQFEILEILKERCITNYEKHGLKESTVIINELSNNDE